jgi:2-dehydropantoate 2-reductase
VAVLGAGAVGCYFGGMLARAGAPVTLIGRPSHVEAVSRDGLWLESLHFRDWVRVGASVAVEAARGAAVVLLAVKTLDTEDAARSLAPHLAPGAVVLSLQNGVDNVERIRASSGIDALPAVVYVAAAMTGPGRVRHSGRGDLLVGDPAGGRRGEAERVAALFARAGVPCVVSDNIRAELWAKMAMNCAYNALSALGRVKYGRIAADPEARAVLRSAVEETVAVARASGVRFPDVDLVAAAYRLGEAMSEATSSTAQDIARGKRTEIDSLNGHVSRRGAELGVPTPVNHALHALVKLLESAMQAGGAGQGPGADAAAPPR